VLLSVSGTPNSFQELVKRYSGDIPYRAVLDELVADGSVERIEENKVKLIQRAYLPKADESMKLHILGVDTAFLVDTIEHNLNRKDQPPRFQRKVLYDNLPDEALPEFRRFPPNRPNPAGETRPVAFTPRPGRQPQGRGRRPQHRGDRNLLFRKTL
jgi:hypothetical protein